MVPLGRTTLGHVQRRGSREGTARQIVRAMYDELAATADADQKKRLFNWAQRSDNVQRLRAMADLARHPLRVADECLDAQPWLLTVANGTVDLRTGQLRAASPTDYITKLAPVAYSEDATCPEFEKLIAYAMGDDPALIAALQCALGYTFVRDSRRTEIFHRIRQRQ